MGKHLIVPCVWMNDQAEAAAGFYVDVFRKGDVVARSYFPSSGANPAKKPPGSVLTVEVELWGQRFTLLNGGPQFRPNQTISFFVNAETVHEVERLFTALATGGQVMMPLGAYPWSERYGWVADRHGVSWQVMIGRQTEGTPRIYPCLMFNGKVQGRAEAAMRRYAEVFPGSQIESVGRYEEGEGARGSVKHGRLVLGGRQLVICMDSHVDHGARFDEGVSLQVMCKDQAEIDHYWKALAAGGAEGPCGWVTDEFGVSWQVVPDVVTELLSSGDARARDRAFAAIMDMKKLDVASIERAYAGR